MPRGFSKRLKSNLSTLSTGEHPLVLIEITHDSLPFPIRLVNDKCDLVSQGERYIACSFDLQLPDETDSNLPRAVLSITNIGRKLSYWVERTIGAMAAQIRIILVLRSSPDDQEWDICTDLINLSMNISTIDIQLGFDDLLNRVAVPVVYNTEKAPGLF